MNGVSKKTNKKCPNSHILIAVKENSKNFKMIQFAKIPEKNSKFLLKKGTINIWHARFGKFDPAICHSFHGQSPNPTCPEDMIDHTQAWDLYYQSRSYWTIFGHDLDRFLENTSKPTTKDGWVFKISIFVLVGKTDRRSGKWLKWIPYLSCRWRMSRQEQLCLWWINDQQRMGWSMWWRWKIHWNRLRM